MSFGSCQTFSEYITEVIDLVILCNPNNPTGILFPKELYVPLIKQCRNQNCVLAVDECFQDFLVKDDQCSFLEVWKSIEERKRGKLFLFKAFTKMYGIPGLRMGYGVSTEKELIRKMKKERQSWNVSIPAQYAGKAALKEEAFAERTRNYVSGERKWMMERLEELGFQVFFDSRANYVFFKNSYPINLYRRVFKKRVINSEM